MNGDHPRLENANETTVNKALVRGLNVLIAVNEIVPATVTKVVQHTALPKATVLRMLATLKDQGFIDFDTEVGGYSALPKVRRLAGPMLTEDTFTLAVRNFLAEFSESVKWPSDFLLPDGLTMVRHATNRHVAPINLKRFEQTRFPMAQSASGLAYLTACSAHRRQALLTAVAELRSDGASETNIAEDVNRVIKATRSRGYSQVDYDLPLEGTRVVSVPVLVTGTPVAAITLVLIKDVVEDARLTADLVPRLNMAAEEIGSIYVAHRAGSGGTNHYFGERETNS